MRRLYWATGFSFAGLLMVAGWTAHAADPSFETTARYILEVVKAFRTAYVLQVVEHIKGTGVSVQEDWEKNAHLLPLPAQFVKGAADQVDGLEIGLIGLAPLNPANRPKTTAEVNALIQLEKNRDKRFVGFMDGDQFKALSADLALVQSCVDCHNRHPRSSRRNFQRWDVMGALVVRFKPDGMTEGLSLPAEPPKRGPGPLERMTPPPTTAPPWVR
ncbi:conserved exported protein of unknown function [Nitrospira japonica]|uniref:Tll0287-like domain-containing protein n=1 Tax=Nitrospira japonica TaxID=1325564 RepID=A0A1W1I0X1_9BACT|nr:DUF3365 domain-containing protein [Nitrospira japonica]SLM46624.1 conserved exported protein of unknown function [Nitrospira japonica]